MLPFLGRLGISKGENDFDYDNILLENKNRKFSVSKLDPMNSNIALVLYKCDEFIWGSSTKSGYLLRAFYNENLVQIDGCKSVDCALEDFLDYYGDILTQCVSSEDVCNV